MAKLDSWQTTPPGATTKLSLARGQVSRIAILDPVPEAIRFHRVEDEGNFQCLGQGCPFCAVQIEWKIKYASYIFLYNQTAQGALIGDAAGQPTGGCIMPWVFPAKKYASLKALSMSLGSDGDLRGIDIQLLCTEEKFQDYTIMPYAGGAPYWQQYPALKAMVDEQYPTLPKDLSGKIARKLTVDEANQLLARVSGQAAFAGQPAAGQTVIAAPGGAGWGAPVGQPVAAPAAPVAAPVAAPAPMATPPQATPDSAPVAPVPIVQPVQAPPMQVSVPVATPEPAQPTPVQAPVPVPVQEAAQPSPADPQASMEDARNRIDSLMDLP